MIGALYVISRLLRLEWRPYWRHGPGRWILDLCILLAGGLVAGLALGRGGRLDFFGMPVSVRGLYTPMFLLTLLVLARVLITLGPHVSRVTLPNPRAIGAVIAAGLTGAVVLSPALYGASQRVLDGTWVSPPIYWRSSPARRRPAGVPPAEPLAPADGLAHRLGAAGRADGLRRVHRVAQSGGAGGGGRRLASRPPSRRVVTLTVGFALMALGPFIHVAGLNT